MKPKCSLNIVKVTADPGFEFLCCLKCFNSINNQNSSSRHQSQLKSHNLSLLQALLFHWVSKRQGGRLWSDLGKMKFLTKLQFNQIESSALMAQSRSEPPPESDFSESFFNLNSTLSESFGKVGQIDRIWGWIWLFLDLKVEKPQNILCSP